MQVKTPRTRLLVPDAEKAGMVVIIIVFRSRFPETSTAVCDQFLMTLYNQPNS